ncbi:MAG TPA: hypothetical protein VK658_23230 [Chryseolinea sp.]|nr:hypothetical protein [Chryseolinea sp.]
MNVERLVLCVVLWLPAIGASAQWNTLASPTRIYYSDGNVGIGTDAPDHALSVFRDTGATLGITSQQGTSDAGLWFRINSTGWDAAIIYRSDGRLSFNLDRGAAWVDTNEYMTILGTGNIGMGMTTPNVTSRLHLKSPQTNGQGLIVEASENGKFVSVGHDGNSGILSSGFIGGDSFSGLQFNTSDIPRMKIAPDGRIGIGTLNPDALLTVNGAIHSTEVKIDTDVPVPDYVFQADYQMLSLEEVEAYIVQNRHLPEVPTASQFEKDGINIGVMNMLLLKKIEELTLHQIRQEKEINAFKEKIRKMETAKAN